MEIIRNRRVSENQWRAVPEGALEDELLAHRPESIIVALSDWQRHGRTLATRGPVGVRLAPEDDIESIVADLDTIALIALEFGGFTEGRPYSMARKLRERFGYRGEIRAVGDVSRDRLAFMERCGINAFELRDDCNAHEALRAFGEISQVYQRAADSRAAASARRD